jgi:hypothetical protein
MTMDDGWKCYTRNLWGEISHNDKMFWAYCIEGEMHRCTDLQGKYHRDILFIKKRNYNYTSHYDLHMNELYKLKSSGESLFNKICNKKGIRI